jgi:hypothetical protein
MNHRDLKLAEYILARGWIIPVDLAMRLYQAGIDVDRL